MAQQFHKVSEWVQAGNMATGLYLMESEVKETAKAIAFKATRPNALGFPVECLCWMPKSVLQRVENDFYTQGNKIMWLVGRSFLRRKEAEGYIL